MRETHPDQSTQGRHKHYIRDATHPVFKAIDSNDVEKVKELLHQDQDSRLLQSERINVPHPYYWTIEYTGKQTPLLVAAQKGCLTIMEVLLDQAQPPMSPQELNQALINLYYYWGGPEIEHNRAGIAMVNRLMDMGASFQDLTHIDDTVTRRVNGEIRDKGMRRITYNLDLLRLALRRGKLGANWDPEFTAQAILKLLKDAHIEAGGIGSLPDRVSEILTLDLGKAFASEWGEFKKDSQAYSEHHTEHHPEINRRITNHQNFIQASQQGNFETARHLLQEMPLEQIPTRFVAAHWPEFRQTLVWKLQTVREDPLFEDIKARILTGTLLTKLMEDILSNRLIVPSYPGHDGVNLSLIPSLFAWFNIKNAELQTRLFHDIQLLVEYNRQIKRMTLLMPRVRKAVSKLLEQVMAQYPQEHSQSLEDLAPNVIQAINGLAERSQTLARLALVQSQQDPSLIIEKHQEAPATVGEEDADSLTALSLAHISLSTQSSLPT